MKTWIGHYESGNSDKVYVVRAFPDGAEWRVDVFFGRRFGNLQHQEKSKHSTQASAETAAHRLFNSKIVKGYQNVEDYGATVREPIIRWLEKRHVVGNMVSSQFATPAKGPVAVNVTNPLPPPPKHIKSVPVPVKRDLPEGKDFVVVCKDVFGLEEFFTEGIEYVAERHDADDMLWVYDKVGTKKECFARRFEVKKESAA